MFDYLKIGSKAIDENGNVIYNKDYFRQGFIYKDEEAFIRHPGQICYIPEDDNDGEDRYTRNDLIDICKGNFDLAKSIFYILDWQHPETVYDEWLTDNKEEQ